MLIVFTVGLEIRNNSISFPEFPKKIFMGFGYNGNLVNESGNSILFERLDLLQYFSYFKDFEDQGLTTFLWDASGFQIVNRCSEKKYRKLGDSPKAEDVLNYLITEQDRSKRREMMQNCDFRAANLSMLCEVTGVNSLVIDARKVWREDKQFTLCLDEALEYTRKLEATNPQLVEKIVPKKATLPARLYLPLEIAEALYLQECFGVEAKFGPKSEQYFDACILDLQSQRGISYTSLWCENSPRRAGYLCEENTVLRVGDDKKVYRTLLSEQAQDQEYSQFVSNYLQSFCRDGERKIVCALRLRDQLLSINQKWCLE